MPATLPEEKAAAGSRGFAVRGTSRVILVRPFQSQGAKLRALFALALDLGLIHPGIGLD